MAKSRTKAAVLRVYNRSRQLVPIQLRPPHGDFFRQEQAVYLGPGKTVTLPKSHLNEQQISNLQKSRHLQIVFDSDLVPARS
jgi:hypothetical protein